MTVGELSWPTAESSDLRTAVENVRYRADIDGLRAFAILPVLSFHAGIGNFTGGFVGVDVFFVISGYLITQIILEDQKRGEFSTLRFYERRVRRIVPALFIVVCCCSIAAWDLFLPDELASFAKSLGSQPLFASNILFWHQNGGYFEPAANTIPLLHTWSLAVEAQFYLAFPLGMSLAMQMGRRNCTAIVGATALASFGLSVWAVNDHPIAAFYLAPFRAWEFLVGALIALGVLPRTRPIWLENVLIALGILFIAVPMFAYTAETPFPGLAALAPVAGTAAVLYSAGNGNCQMRRVLGAKPLVAVGLISYSLYLWHWPLLVFGQSIALVPLSASEAVGLLLIAFVLSIATWRFVEQPFRQKQIFGTRGSLFTAAAISGALLAVIAAITIWMNGFPERISPAKRQAILINLKIKESWTYPDHCSNSKRNFGPNDSLNLCSMGLQDGPRILFWGDSQLEQLYPAIADLASSGRLGTRRVDFATSGGCFFVLDLEDLEPGYHCSSFNAKAMQEALRPNVETVVLGSSFYLETRVCEANECGRFADRHAYLKFLESKLTVQLRKLISGGKRVILVLPFPFNRVPPVDYLNRQIILAEEPVSALITRQQHERDWGDFITTLTTSARAAGAEVLDPLRTLCPNGMCIYRDAYRSLYFDSHHLSADGAKLLEPILERILER